MKKFDYIVSNPPFKLDFSDFRDDLDIPENRERFVSGIPTVPPKKKDSMPIYLLFLQHIIFSLSSKGKAAIVVPTSFLTAEAEIPFLIRKVIVDKKILVGIDSMPSNIFATTGTNVSVLFLDKSKEKYEVVLMDASNLGTIVKEGRSQKTLLTDEDEDLIINSFKTKKNIEHFSHVVKLEKIISNNYSLGASQYAAAWDPSAITRKSNSSFTDETFDSQIQVLLDRKSEALKREEDICAILKELGHEAKGQIELECKFRFQVRK